MHPLDGIKVLDLSRVLAGPWCTQTLADLGAEVWKIEEPTKGDDTRSWLPPDIGGESTYFLCCNRSKKSIAVDLKSKDGLAAVKRLAREADVLVENFRIGTLDRLGLGYEELRRENPRLVYCSISGYGRTGRRAPDAGYDFIIQAESGLMSITGEPDGEPMKLGVAVTDIVTGMNATQAILAALFARERTGRGQLIDIALHDSALALLANVGSGHLGTGRTPARYGNAHATVVPYQMFPTADGALALAVGNDRQFAALCRKVIDLPHLCDSSDYATNAARVHNRVALIAELDAAFQRQTTGHWLALLGECGIPAGRVRTVDQALAAPETDDRDMVVTVADARHGSIRLVGSPLKLSETPVRQPFAPPRLGEHTAEILTGSD